MCSVCFWRVLRVRRQRIRTWFTILCVIMLGYLWWLTASQRATPTSYKRITECLPASISVWPLPQKTSEREGNFTLSLYSEFAIHTTSESPILKEGIKRYHAILQSISKKHAETGNSSVRRIEIVIDEDDERLSLNTSYKYTVTVDVDSGIAIHAETPFGALYGLETVSQLFVGGCLKASHVHIEDHPDYRHRGFMLDTGRRFVPKELLLNFLDAMSYLKMNVFHWHLSDFCIFSIESKVFPKLSSCYDKDERYYTQEDAKEVVQYAKNRGIRVIPELDVPGHASGMRCLSENMSFCGFPAWGQVYNDAGGQSVSVLKKLFEEIMGIFPDQYVHMGADESWNVLFFQKCNSKNVNILETEIARFIMDKGRIPVAWQEAFDSSQVDVPGLVLQAWYGRSASYFAKKGHPSIESRKEWYYFDYPYGSRDYWTLWNSPLGMEDENSPHQNLILGGEFAMWGDMYTKVWQCGHYLIPKTPNAHWLHDKALDEYLMDSMAGQVWPRGIASAGRFWHHVPSLDKKDLADRVDRQAQVMISRGVRSCPIGCECDCATRCGRQYPQSL